MVGFPHKSAFQHLAFFVATQYTRLAGHLAQFLKGALCLGGGEAALEVQVEVVLPDITDDGARLYLGKVDALVGEALQAQIQATGDVFGADYERGFVGIAFRFNAITSYDQEPHVVLLVGADVAREDVHAVKLGGEFRCHSGSMSQFLLFYHTHRSGSIICLDALYLGVLFQEEVALGHSSGVAVNLGNVLDIDTGEGDEVINDVQVNLSHNPTLVLEQQVVVVQEGAIAGILDGHHSVLCLTLFDILEHLLVGGALDDLTLARETGTSYDVVERTASALDGNLDHSTPPTPWIQILMIDEGEVKNKIVVIVDSERPF